ncbi:hypothetical protein DFJ74DRAFT_659915 [Hyaloraphidium curvatum]|nr:hypothetical protein DFJ74DRAFT_659915 [Hyaloraphidium curvatum]
MSHETRASAEGPVRIVRRRHSQQAHGLSASSRSHNGGHAPSSPDSETMDYAGPGFPSASIDPQHGVSIILAPDNLPRTLLPSTPPSLSPTELEKMLNSPTARTSAGDPRTGGRTLVVLCDPGDALPALFGPLVEALAEAREIESDARVFAAVEELPLDRLGSGRWNAVVLASGYTAWGLIGSLGSAAGNGRTRRVAGVVLVDAYVDPEGMGKIDGGAASQAAGFVLQFATGTGQDVRLQRTLRDTLGSRLVELSPGGDVDAAGAIAAEVLEFVDGRAGRGSAGRLGEEERMDANMEMADG